MRQQYKIDTIPDEVRAFLVRKVAESAGVSPGIVRLLRVTVFVPDDPLAEVPMRVEFDVSGYRENALMLTYPSYASFEAAMWELYLGG